MVRVFLIKQIKNDLGTQRFQFAANSEGPFFLKRDFMKTYNHYINDEWVEPSSGAYLESENPFTGEIWARVARGNGEDAD